MDIIVINMQLKMISKMAEPPKNGVRMVSFLTEVLILISDICKQRGPHGLYGYKLHFRREFTKNPDYSI